MKFDLNSIIGMSLKDIDSNIINFKNYSRILMITSSSRINWCTGNGKIRFAALDFNKIIGSYKIYKDYLILFEE